ncbi:MAG: Uma2 family endonuclease [Acidimicrobiales bacterium]
MSSVVVAPEVVTLPVPPRPFVAADIEHIAWDGRRWEVIDGMLVVSPSPFGRHQWSIGRLYLLLQEACPPDLLVILAPYDWISPAGDRLEPDLLVFRRDDFDPDGHLRATPLLVIEVLSRSNPGLDTAVKRARYEALGVEGYWMLDPASPGTLVVLRLVDGAYVTLADCQGDEAYAADFPFPVRVVPASLVP